MLKLTTSSPENSAVIYLQRANKALGMEPMAVTLIIFFNVTTL